MLLDSFLLKSVIKSHPMVGGKCKCSRHFLLSLEMETIPLCKLKHSKKQHSLWFFGFWAYIQSLIIKIYLGRGVVFCEVGKSYQNLS